MSSPAAKRLLADFKTISQAPPENILASPYEDDLFKWAAIIIGPADTCWEGTIIRIEMQFPSDYPLRPPEVRILTKLFHPNIFPDGRICLDLLRDKWSNALSVASILLSIQSLLTDPNPNSPANAEASRLYVADRHSYDIQVIKCAEDSWSGVSAEPYAELLKNLIDNE